MANPIDFLLAVRRGAREGRMMLNLNIEFVTPGLALPPGGRPIQKLWAVGFRDGKLIFVTVSGAVIVVSVEGK